MNYKILIIIFFLFISACANQNFNKKTVIEPIIVKKYSNSGFTLIYTEELFLDRIVNKKLNDRDLFIFQKNLKKNTDVKITNQLNNKSIIATVKNKAKYPNFYNSVITTRIATEIELDLNEPFILVESIDKNSVFYAGKAKMFEEEKKVADKAPVEDITINNLNKEKKKKVDKKITKSKFSFIIKVADFYFKNSAELIFDRIKKETPVNKLKIMKISKNQYRVYSGPFKNLKSLKKAFNAISIIDFENLEIIKQ